jgi:hypothetical protein
MKFVCLGYIDEKWAESVPRSDFEALMDECFTYDDFLRERGHFAGGEALETSLRSATLRWRDGKVVVTDGPYAETKEQIGGILILEAKDMDEAIELMSRHPGVRAGPFEIRAAADLQGFIDASAVRRGVRNA